MNEVYQIPLLNLELIILGALKEVIGNLITE